MTKITNLHENIISPPTTSVCSRWTPLDGMQVNHDINLNMYELWYWDLYLNAFVPQVMDIALEVFGDALRGNVTAELLASAQTDGDNRVFYDDFLGDGDWARNKKKIVCQLIFLYFTHYLLIRLYMTEQASHWLI